MRNLTHLNVPKDTQAKFPFGTIQNETPTQEGTPVFRELYGDILNNIWKIIELSGINFTGDEDSNDTQYQLVDALRKFYNELNDVEQNISLNGSVWNVNLDLSKLPNKYVFIGNVSDDYVSGTPYQFKGTGATLISAISPTGFKATDEVIVVIDTAGVRIYSIASITATVASNINVLAPPLTFNDSDIINYLSDGRLFTNEPKTYNIQESIQTVEQNVNLFISDAVIYSGKLVCLVFDSTAVSYRVFTFPLTDLSSPVEVVYSGFAVSPGTDRQVYMYCDGTALFFTNNFNNSANDYDVMKISLTANTNTLTLVSTIPLNAANFKKTTNTVINNNKLYHFVGSELKSHDLNALTVATVFDNYTLYSGNLFKFKGEVYFNSNGVTAPWTL